MMGNENDIFATLIEAGPKDTLTTRLRQNIREGL